MITADQIIVHAIGDYVLQSDWMANEKTKRWFPAFCHALVYSIPFWFLIDRDVRGQFLETFPHPVDVILIMGTIFGTHYLIDRYRLARYVVWAKNFLAPAGSNTSWADCAGTGYPSARPAWLAVWLLILADNICHILLNGFALRYL